MESSPATQKSIAFDIDVREKEANMQVEDERQRFEERMKRYEGSNEKKTITDYEEKLRRAEENRTKLM